MKLFCSLLIFITSVCYAKKLPSYIEQCYRGDDEAMSACILRNIDQLRPRMAKGIPELQVPPLDPLEIPSAVIANENTFKCDLKNVKLYHVDNIKFNKFRMSFDGRKWDSEMEYPSLGIVTDYHMVGKLLVLELNSMGESRGNMTAIKLKNHVDLDVVERNGKEHFTVKSSTLNATIGFSHMDFDNLFGKNEELNQRANKVLNDNYAVFLEEFTPVIANIMNEFINHILENFYKKYSLDVIFPEKPNK